MPMPHVPPLHCAPYKSHGQPHSKVLSRLSGVVHTREASNFCREQKERMLGQRGCVVWFTGLSGSGKSTVACTVEHELARRSSLTALLDGDNVRHGLNQVQQGHSKCTTIAAACGPVLM